MASATTTILCLTMLLSFIDLSVSNALRHALPAADAPVPELQCQNGGHLVAIASKLKCNCTDGYIGDRCELVSSRRCKVRSSDPKTHQHPNGCPSGFWCVADNINCYFYTCGKTEGWCVPIAPNLKPDASAEKQKDLMNKFEGTEGEGKVDDDDDDNNNNDNEDSE